MNKTHAVDPSTVPSKSCSATFKYCSLFANRGYRVLRVAPHLVRKTWLGMVVLRILKDVVKAIESFANNVFCI